MKKIVTRLAALLLTVLIFQIPVSAGGTSYACPVTASAVYTHIDKGIYTIRLSGNTSNRLTVVVYNTTNKVTKVFYTSFKPEVHIPLCYGEGVYQIEIYIPTARQNRHRIKLEPVTVSSVSDIDVYTQPNVYVDFTDSRKELDCLSQKMQGMSAGNKVAYLYKHMSRSFNYDKEYASSPDLKARAPMSVSQLEQAGKGICEDFAVYMAAALRYNGIPTKVVIGNWNGKCHAWLNVYYEGKWHLADPTMVVCDPSLGTNFNNSEYIPSGKTY